MSSKNTKFNSTELRTKPTNVKSPDLQEYAHNKTV